MRRVQRATSNGQRASEGPTVARCTLHAARSARAASGLVLVDLLVLLLTLALLLTVVVPEFSALRRRSLEGVMRADLRRLAAAEDSYFYDHHVYSADAARLQGVGFQPSPGVHIEVREATDGGGAAGVVVTGAVAVATPAASSAASSLGRSASSCADSRLSGPEAIALLPFAGDGTRHVRRDLQRPSKLLNDLN